MEIENDDDLDFEVDEIQENEETGEVTEDTSEDSQTQENSEENPEESNENPEEDFMDTYLRSRGIDDKSKIKFENEEGEIEEVDWNSLDNNSKLNILSTSESVPEEGLDDSEIQLINTIRSSGMNPSEYINYIQNSAVENYSENNKQPQFEINQYNDEELFLMDLISRTEDITEEEAVEVLERAKANEGLFKKQVDAIRSEYQQAEQENLLQAQAEQEQALQQQYEHFTNQIVDEINDLTEIQGYDLNLENDDMQTLYDFITGQDAAGNNYFTKALSDPKILVKTAWLALNGDQMINDITNYFQREIANVRKESYKKGVEDTKNKKNNVVYKPKSKAVSTEYADDLDDF